MCRRLVSVWAVFLMWSTSSVADDHLLTIGGGPAANNNQVSLEKNIYYLQRVLRHLNLDNIHQTILFADGRDEGRDLQFDAQRDPEDIRMLLAEILGPSNGMKYDYRTSILPIVDGAATPQVIDSTLKELAANLHDGDRLIIYFTGHGGRPRGWTPPDRRNRGRESAAPTSPTASEPNPPRSEKTTDAEDPDQPPEQKKEAAKPSTNDSGTGETSSGQEPEEAAKSPGKPDTENGEGRETDSERPAQRTRRRTSFPNNVIHLWNGSNMSVTEWTQKLDKLPTEVPVVAIMVQCYSGGFGNFIFTGGNPDNGMAMHHRCGFFSTVPDRVAAGCTPNVNEADYREYSSYFFEAICGESRTGESVERPDYDQDGQTSFLEAHAYTVLNADTIDIPVRTSDIYLRHFAPARGADAILTSHSPIDSLLEDSSPIARAVVEGLSDRFELHGNDRAKDVENSIRQIRADKQRIDGEIRQHRQLVTNIKKEIADALKLKWPELANPWHPETARLVNEEPQLLLDAIRSHKRYEDFRNETRTIETLTEESEQKELQIVKLERLQYWLETLALQANLKALNDEKLNAEFQRLVELESSCLVKENHHSE